MSNTSFATVRDHINELCSDSGMELFYGDPQIFLNALESHFCLCSINTGKIYEKFELCLLQGQCYKYLAVSRSSISRHYIGKPLKYAISEIPAFVMEGGIIGLKGLVVVFEHDGEIEALPVEDAFELLNQRYITEGGFYPVLTLTKLSFRYSAPFVPLSRVKVKKLTFLSEFERRVLLNSIAHKAGRLLLSSSNVA